jgi:hypothetical protein
VGMSERERQTLGSIEHGLAGSDPALASMLGIFSRLTSGEEMPVHEKIRIRRARPAAHRSRRARRHPRRGIALPPARRLYARLGPQQAMLLLWAVISAGLIAVALVLNHSGHRACIRLIGTACPSPSIRQHADASQLMNLRPLAGAFLHRQPTSYESAFVRANLCQVTAYITRVGCSMRLSST